jgi:hypothetical protein
VRLPRILVPKEPRNLVATAIVCAGLFALDLLLVPVWQRSPKRGLGLAFGVLATALFLFEMSYPLRRPRSRPLGSAKRWMQAHVYLGLVALLAVVIHAGYTLPHGLLGWLLLGLSVWTTLSGLVGVFLQKWIPAALAEGLTVTALYERIPSLVDGLTEEADALVESGSDALGEFYRTQVREELSRLKPSLGYFLDVRGGREGALAPFRRVAAFLPTEEQEKVESLMNLYSDKMELDAQFSLQGVLRRWSLWTLHVPMAGILLGLVALHILTWILY